MGYFYKMHGQNNDLKIFSFRKYLAMDQIPFFKNSLIPT